MYLRTSVDITQHDEPWVNLNALSYQDEQNIICLLSLEHIIVISGLQISVKVPPSWFMSLQK